VLTTSLLRQRVCRLQLTAYNLFFFTSYYRQVKPVPISHTHFIFSKAFLGLGVLLVYSYSNMFRYPFVNLSVQDGSPVLSAFVCFILY
jgi:hypothetical protein